jgi:PAS domain S-box-containing protein
MIRPARAGPAQPGADDAFLPAARAADPKLPVSLRARPLTELQLYQRESVMRLLVEGAGDFAICLLDPSGLVVHWDEGAEQLLGYGETEVAGRHFSLFYTKDDRGMIEQALDEALSLGRHKSEHWFIGKDSAGFWASTVVIPMTDPMGKLIGFAVMVRSITRRREEGAALTRAKELAEDAARTAQVLSAELQAANKELRASNDSLQRFTSIVAHDLRAPLGQVETFVQFLATDYCKTLDAEGQDIMARLDAGVTRMRRMLTSLLEYTKCGRTATQGKIADLALVVDAALVDLELSPGDVDLTVDLGGVGEVAGDLQLLSHVLHNLVGNAVKFRRLDRRSLIAIEARSLGNGQVEVSVTDNGIGIEARFSERVFEMLYRLHNHDEYEGTGIGLSVCRKIIRDHGGEIWIESANPVGTRVVFTLVTPVGQDVETG